MDPAYDSPPGDDYICIICQARGKHFKSTCPHNTDPLSITQKRKAAGLAENNTMMGKAKQSSDSKPRMQREESVDSVESISEETFHNQESRIGEKRGREIEDLKVRTMMKRIRIENDPDGGDWPGDMVIREERISNSIYDTADRVTSSQSAVKEYHAFVHRLARRFGDQMTEVVNPIQRRPTAVEMWEKDGSDNMDQTGSRFVYEYNNCIPMLIQRSSPWESLINASSPIQASENNYSPVNDNVEMGRLTPYSQDI